MAAGSFGPALHHRVTLLHRDLQPRLARHLRQDRRARPVLHLRLLPRAQRVPTGGRGGRLLCPHSHREPPDDRDAVSSAPDSGRGPEHVLPGHGLLQRGDIPGERRHGWRTLRDGRVLLLVPSFPRQHRSHSLQLAGETPLPVPEGPEPGTVHRPTSARTTEPEHGGWCRRQ